MFLKNEIVWFFAFVTLYPKVFGDPPNFRVLAPEFVCPNDANALIEKPDNTVITVKTDAMDLKLSWTVRWTDLDKPAQRFVLLLWKTVRALEVKLNAPQPEPFVYVIDNAELLEGVEYIFNVTALDPESKNSTTKRFAIDNMKGDPTLLIEGRSEKMSVILLAAEALYADMETVVEAEVTMCSPTQDYNFSWSVLSSSASEINELDTSGSRLEIPPYSLQAGASYYVSCTVYRNSGEFVTQTGLPFQILHRGLAASLNFDVLVLTRNKGFHIEAVVDNYDHHGKKLEFQWSCIFENEPCNSFETLNSDMLIFTNGLHCLGQYEIIVVVTVEDQEASSNATIIVIEPNLPVIQVESLPRIINEHTMITLLANASNVAPSCNLAWYFANEGYLASIENGCDNCQKNGIELEGSVTITSMEEVFLYELTDFSNETEWRQIEAQIKASTGRARFVAQCVCSLTFNCDTKGTVYADVNFILNESPKVGEIMVSPETGTSMETMFRLSTLAASDPDKPLRYNFYCDLGNNDTLTLSSFLEHLAVETFLPYIDVSGTKIWLEVCDSLGACMSSKIKIVQVLEGEGRTVEAIVASIPGYVARCEIMLLRRLVQSAVTTYRNTNNQQALSKFTEALLVILSAMNEDCIMKNQDYSEFLYWLSEAGIDISSNTIK